MLNFKGIYAVLSQIWKFCKSRNLVLIFWVKKLVGANFTRFCNYASAVVEATILNGVKGGAGEQFSPMHIC